MNINVLKELEEHGITFERNSDAFVKVICPYHDDKAPSGSLNIEFGRFKCFACKKKKSFFEFLLHSTGKKYTVSSLNQYLGSKYGRSREKTIAANTVKRHASAIDESFLKKTLLDKGLTEEVIKEYDLGSYVDPQDGKPCITIPIPNERQEYVNLRKYVPNGKPKFRNEKGFGKNRLYPIDQLEYDTIVIAGGELKALALVPILNPKEIGVVSTTAGEPNWEFEFNEKFKGKTVYVCYDIDAEGKSSSHNVCMAIHPFAEQVFNISLPLDIEKYPAGDINDFLLEGRDFLVLLEDLNHTQLFVPYIPKLFIDMNQRPEFLPFATAISAEGMGRRIKTEAVVSTVNTEYTLLPTKVKAVCTKDQKCCALCQVYPHKQEEFEIPRESDLLVNLVNRGRRSKKTILKDGLGIPEQCPVVTFEEMNNCSVETVRISSKLDLTSREANREMQLAYIIWEDEKLKVEKGVEMNSSYLFTGRMYPNPEDATTTLIFSDLTPTKDALESYDCKNPEKFKLFQPKVWTAEGIGTKLTDIYEDLSANVTHIYKRNDLHLAVDLGYHSPLFFTFDQSSEIKGWTEILIIGDSSQGKSDTCNGLHRHYGLGQKVDCKGSTRSGLKAGSKKFGNNWVVEWGTIPCQDKRVAILEEFKGISYEQIGEMTDMRSSGIAEVNTIVKRTTRARTRLVANSNPRSNRNVDEYSNGVQIVKELVGNHEDIRRFDMVLILSKEDLDINDLVTLRPKVEHKYTSELCKELILWAWTRNSDQVYFEDESYVLKVTKALCEAFDDDVPIVDRASMRFKLARLSAALAARLFSTDQTGQNIFVRNCCVKYIAQYLHRIYCSPAFKYDRFTEMRRKNKELGDKDAIEKALREAGHPAKFCELLQGHEDLSVTFLKQASGLELQDFDAFMSVLLTNNCLVPYRRGYRKTAPFIKYLEQNKIKDDRPAFLSNGDF